MTFKFPEAQRETSKEDKPDHRYRFYDVDLDVIREELTNNVYLGGSKKLDNPEKLKEHQELLAAIEQWIDYRNNRKPEPGQYDATKPEKHVPTFDFDKYQARDEAFPDDDDDMEPGEGDVLILDPQLPKKHEPNFDFSKYQGRPDEFHDSDEELEQLIINPKDDITRKKVPGTVAFDKLTGRPVPEVDIEEPEPVDLSN